MVCYVIHFTSVGKTWYHSDHIGKEYTVELIISYVYKEDESTKKKEAAALLLLIQLSELN